MVACVDAQREDYGVESICAQLPIAPSTYWRQKAQAADPRKRSARAQRDDVLKGDAYDNALAESVIGLYKTEVIARRDRWRTLEAVEFATLRWVDWFNHRRLLGPIGFVPPAEFEARYYQQVSVA